MVGKNSNNGASTLVYIKQSTNKNLCMENEEIATTRGYEGASLP